MISMSTLFALQRYIDTNGEVNLNSGLVAHYLLNNNADDCVGTFDGTPTDVDFKGYVASFNDPDTSDISISTISNIKTLSIWFTIDDFTRYNAIISVYNGDAEYSHLISWGTDNVLRFYVIHDVYFDVANINDLTEGQLYNLVVTANGTTVSAYLDNVSSGSVSTSILLEIRGFGFSGASRCHEGHISNIRLYNDVKDQAFIDDLYAEGYYPKPLPLPTTDGLIAHYPLTGTAEDSTGNYDSSESSATYKDDAGFGSVYDGGGSISVNSTATGLAGWCCYWLNSGSGWVFTRTTTIPTLLTTDDYRNLRLYDTTPSTEEQDETEAYELNFRSIDIDNGLIAYYPLKNNSNDNYYNEYDATDSAGVTYSNNMATIPSGENIMFPSAIGFVEAYYIKDGTERTTTTESYIDNFSDCTLSEVRKYNRNLSQEQIDIIYPNLILEEFDQTVVYNNTNIATEFIA